MLCIAPSSNQEVPASLRCPQAIRLSILSTRYKGDRTCPLVSSQKNWDIGGTLTSSHCLLKEKSGAGCFLLIMPSFVATWAAKHTVQFSIVPSLPTMVICEHWLRSSMRQKWAPHAGLCKAENLHACLHSALQGRSTKMDRELWD